jgi:hypothetical protein
MHHCCLLYAYRKTHRLLSELTEIQVRNRYSAVVVVVVGVYDIVVQWRVRQYKDGTYGLKKNAGAHSVSIRGTAASW